MFDTKIDCSLGAPPEEYGEWGWFAALGVGCLVAGAISSLNLFSATLVSVLYIAAMMLAGGVMQIIHAFTTSGWGRRSLYVLAGLLYAAAGAIAFYDPLLTAVDISLVLGILLIAAGIVRIVTGLQLRNQGGWRWIAGSGVFTIIVGMFIVATWPAVGLWLLGAILTVDLLFQGGGFIGLGLSLRSRQKHRPSGRSITH
ncbi:HdeD family acid-resistance protein [Mesorhizobium sp. CO1-1-8]|uniref:HdeD family acid-resistance protein n=1 Tax=Mesorhizobium sp. CO1-1-8 TaxID=2876631 RepID=UPI001CD122A4|nr:HdeD family acid-resistance protein [Mesorhizobium sp. CO1-1-8]MBZ9774033.1 HdeD family acid-resistance protein [Mesorhizobium sp. CO1-1-8]